eukprot:CAMPEP_0171029618 /NCGR_PEP_ID=MMETSP0736-20130129/36508_1 /TAXON_ID=186038 /ORGANISM="Fragilariopsis kerguelensis, Strain L26-C5" /LENGTH=464 /DNA_ID=CAMNT_0011471425 /DNA_START=134 /DNA_END=1528 /DNA_ORIENTATION=-
MRQQQQKQQHNRVLLLLCIATTVLMITMMPTGVMSMSILGPAIIPTTAAPAPLIPSNSVVTVVTETTAAETIAEAAASTAVTYSDYGVLMYLASKNSNNEVDENVVDKLKRKDDDTNNSTITAPNILEMNGKTTVGTAVTGTTTATTEIGAEGIKTGIKTSSSSPSIAVTTVGTNKRTFFNSLETTVHLNDATPERTQLLTKMIDEKLIMDVKTQYPTPTLNSVDHNTEQEDGTEATVVVPTISYDQPGWINTFLSVPPVLSSSVPSSSTAVVPQMQQQQQQQQPIAVGTWKVVYAPHITTVANLFKGHVDVQYQMSVDNDDPKRTIVSHAYYDFPLVGKGYLSVSGTYGSVLSTSTSTSTLSSKNDKKNEYYSKVNFDQAWMKPVRNDVLVGKPQQPQDGSSTTHPYETYDDVPSSWSKTLINEVGKRFFVDDVAIFPVRFLDADTIVFDFELLGTKICAHKV